MTQEFVASTAITNLNTYPIQVPTAGEGAPGILRRVTDIVSPTAAGMATIGSFYRLCRFPTGAKIKGLRMDFGTLDTGGATAVFDINVAFSDTQGDGTQSVNQPISTSLADEKAALCIPKTGQAGAAGTSVTAYSTPNKLFGQVTVGNNTTKLNQDLLFNGAYAAGGVGKGPNVAWLPFGTDYPVWEFLGYTSNGLAVDPGGYFDLLLYLSTAATTGAASYIRAALDFVY